MQAVAPQQQIGQPTPVGQVIPVLVTTQEHAFKLNLEESITLHGEQFYFDAPTCGEVIKQICCPLCISVNYVSDSHKTLEFYNSCMLCSSWKVKVDGQLIGSTNGYKKKLCDCLSNVSIQEFRGPDKKVKYTIKKQNSLATCLCSSVYEKFAAFGLMLRQCSDCCSYLNNKQYVVSREDIMDATGDVKIGEVIQVHRLQAVAYGVGRVPIKFQVNVNTPQQADDLALLGLLPMFYNGLPVPCRHCIKPPAEPITGVSCLDKGRNGECHRTNMSGYLSSIKAPSSVKMAR